MIKTLVKTKLLEGKYIEAREYELFKGTVKLIHCENDYRTCLHDKCGYMYLTVSQQKKGKVVNTLQSKFPPYSYYRMYKYLWKPEYNRMEKSISTYGALSKLAEREGWEDLGRKLHK